MEHGYTVGLLKKSNIKAHKEVSNVIDKRDEYSLEMKGSGLEKLTEMKEMDKVEHPAQDPLQNNSLEMCDQTMEAKSQWNMVQNLGVTSGQGYTSVLTKLLCMEERDKEETNKMGNRGAG